VKCIHCSFPLPDGKYKCVNSKCRMWSITSTVSLEDSTVLLSDAKLGVVERVLTGIVDNCFGPPENPGMVTTSVNLLAGDPGAGKTTLCLMLSNFFAGHFNKEVLYIANEQEDIELKDTAQRLHLDHANKIRIVKAMGGLNYELGTIILHYKPCLIILDSVTKWAGEDPREAVLICQRLKDYSVRIKAPCIVINQVTKGGEHAGLNKMQHAVDATMMFEVWGDNPSDPRRLHVRKNRNGPAPVSQFFEMTPTGLFGISELEALERLKSSDQDRPTERKYDDEDDEEEDGESGNNSAE
jgi:predicted ATP-dependent serine protease